MIELRLRINGEERIAEVAEHESLLTALRERFGLAGSKNACEQGECGSCSVLLDGALVCSCLVLAAAAQDREVSTVESLARTRGPATRALRAAGAPAPGREERGDGDEEDALHPVQRAFVEAGAVQCGFCTPGLVVATYALLRENPEPTEAEVREALSGNLCRCTGYGKILEAVQRAAHELYP